MGYELALHVLNAPPPIPLSKGEYESSIQAMTDLVLLAEMEEQAYLVLGNFLEFEADLLGIAARLMIRIPFNYQEFRAEHNLIVNRRLTNLLSACRGYLDHTHHHLNQFAINALQRSLWTRMQKMCL